MKLRSRARRHREASALRLALILREKYPSLPDGEEHRIARYSLAPRTERVGALGEGDGWLAEAAELAAVAHARHRFTAYETLLQHGLSRDEARLRVRDEVTAVLKRWTAAQDTSDSARR